MAHILALKKLLEEEKSDIYNLGNGQGFTVLEVINAAEKVTGKKIEAIVTDRRKGDPAILIADSEKIKKELGWKPEYTEIKSILETAWKWHSQNPQGYSN